MNTYQEKASKLKASASSFYESHLKAMLQPYGEVELLGSYALDLMVWPDLDMQLNLNPGVDRLDVISEVSRHLMQDPDVRHVKLIHFTPRKDSPYGLGMYLGIQYYAVDGNKWHIDLWMKSFEDNAKTKAFTQDILDRLTPENREFILKWKHKLVNDEGRVPKMGSYCLYNAILIHELRLDSEIIDYLVTQGVKL